MVNSSIWIYRHHRVGTGETRGQEERGRNLSKFPNVADALSVQGLKVGSDARFLEVDDAGERLVEERTDRGDGEATSLGGQRVDHGLEAHVDLAGSNELGNIFSIPLDMLAVDEGGGEQKRTGRVVGLQDGDFQVLLGKVTKLLGQIEGRMVWGCLPVC